MMLYATVCCISFFCGWLAHIMLVWFMNKENKQ